MDFFRFLMRGDFGGNNAINGVLKINAKHLHVK